MKDLRNIQRGYTHSGKFHTDDVISAAFIRYFNPRVEIQRVLEYVDVPKEDEIVFDIGLGDFDHHQEERKIDDAGHYYSAFGLLWEAYGKEYLKSKGFKNIDDAFDEFKRNYVFKIDEGDNEGYKNIKGFFENDLIVHCNPKWFEDADTELENKAFEKAVKLGSLLLENWTRTVYENIEQPIYTW